MSELCEAVVGANVGISDLLSTSLDECSAAMRAALMSAAAGQCRHVMTSAASVMGAAKPHQRPREMTPASREDVTSGRTSGACTQWGAPCSCQLDSECRDALAVYLRSPHDMR
jgi:hypothetical protein